MLRYIAFALCLTLPNLSSADVFCSPPKNRVCIETVKTKNGVDVFARYKFELLPISLTLDMTVNNLVVPGGTRQTFIFNGKGRTKLFHLAPRKKGRWTYNFKFQWNRGDETARHTPGYRYQLPFKPGAKYKVTQSCNGFSTHVKSQRYAIDFAMPIGTPIHAARGGRVVSLRENSNRGGPNKSYDNDANFVAIQHDDRTLGIYYHLRKNGVHVSLGQRVKKGEQIGLSGNTGRSTGPHLHFAVVKGTKTDNETSLRFAFKTNKGVISCPKRGQFLRAVRAR